jgi:hypothetical protein
VCYFYTTLKCPFSFRSQKSAFYSRPLAKMLVVTLVDETTTPCEIRIWMPPQNIGGEVDVQASVLYHAASGATSSVQIAANARAVLGTSGVSARRLSSIIHRPTGPESSHADLRRTVGIETPE